MDGWYNSYPAGTKSPSLLAQLFVNVIAKPLECKMSGSCTYHIKDNVMNKAEDNECDETGRENNVRIGCGDLRQLMMTQEKRDEKC
eukprot:scaffold404720_cov15-Prasinocladus_malaysianus.AAC.1